eukprot:CAMPEP_0180528800 /NCGR_PEP_ID=MMETSP1036_2-20121128/61001_1 /TAXON_ID=632150 /ORGANISM="Azadinium spinosum, Strain 3D9" /LENGTH=93 /DNA_ID=CAMNT_0022542403 /DNA_START=8 /DNA_END=286 /DNA_ORIENTATION=+
MAARPVCLDWAEVEERALPAAPASEGLRRLLLEAVKDGDVSRVRSLLQQGARLDSACPELPTGRGNLVDWALHHGQPDMASSLLRVADSVGLG